MAASRKTRLGISYNGKNISKSIKPYVESFKYTDVASGESDSIELNLNNRSFLFMKNIPLKGDCLGISIFRYNWNKAGETKRLNCGKFFLDDLSFSEPPRLCVIGAVSSPVKKDFKSTNRTKTYKNVTIREIAKTIAKRHGMLYHYSAAAIRIKEIEQNNVSDSEFLLDTCQEYGLGIKIFSGKIVIFDEEVYEQKKPKHTIHRKEMISWSWNTTLQGTYTGAKVTCTLPDSDKTHKITIGKAGRMYTADISAATTKEAVLKAKAKLAEENKKRTTMQIVLMPDRNIVATDTIRVSGMYKLNGKFYVDEVEHNIVPESGYVQTLTVHKVTPRISSKILSDVVTKIASKTKKKKGSKSTSKKESAKNGASSG